MAIYEHGSCYLPKIVSYKICQLNQNDKNYKLKIRFFWGANIKKKAIMFRKMKKSDLSYKSLSYIKIDVQYNTCFVI